MFDKSLSRLERVLKHVNYINTLCDRAGGTMSALEDEISARPAIFSHIMSCDEQISKIILGLDIEVSSIFTKEEVRGLKGVRNVISHDYEGVDLDVIANVVDEYLPNIKSKILEFLDQASQQQEHKSDNSREPSNPKKSISDNTEYSI